MSRIESGQTKLAHSLKALLEQWDIVETHWKDSIRDEFEKRHLNELADQSRRALSAMDRLAEIIRQARRDCEPS